jgi:dipicolinate synthase subunit A
MDTTVIFPMSDSPAVSFAIRALEKVGVQVGSALSRATHALFSVPTKAENIPEGVTVIGGNLDFLPDGFPKIDLLRDAQYLAENAHLTADCALRLLGDRLGVAFRGCPILVIGWGRIGKCLAAMLKALEADVTVAARKPSDLGMLTALGYKAVAVSEILPGQYRAIVNTAPAPILAEDGDYLQIDLASQQGLAGETVIWARGLPGKMLPESSGALIAQAILRHLKGGAT